jgi:hypothetical protein
MATMPRLVLGRAFYIRMITKNLKSRSPVQRIRGIFEDDIKASFHALGLSISPTVRICISLSDGRRVRHFHMIPPYKGLACRSPWKQMLCSRGGEACELVASPVQQ